VKDILLENLYDELESLGSECLASVILWNEDCSHCKPFLDGIEKVESDFNKFKFYKLHVDEVPLFAPPAIPSVVIFCNSVRIFEALGHTNEEYFRKALESWQTEWENNIKVHK
jgi:thioredoxin-like negative regulator of GroEL